jgi:tetratricopeptide (TPR) repeat protein
MLAMFAAIVVIAQTTTTTQPQPAEMTLPSGRTFYRHTFTPEIQREREDLLLAAHNSFEALPNDPDAVIWYGRRLAYLDRYHDAINVFTEGIRKSPDEPRLYRHRGHRYITLRQYDAAIDDLKKAESLTKGKPDVVEPDGIPNARNIPTTTLQSNICYHLGLAYYLKGDFERALPVYRRCYSESLSSNADRIVSSANWLYMTLRRMGRAAEAEKVLDSISTSMDVIEDVPYHKLLLMYAGEIAPEELEREGTPSTSDGVTILYGIGNWYLVNGETDRAAAIFHRIVESDQWAAFAYIAAESELARP